MAAAPKVAIVHDWLTSFGGAERCLILLHQLFPTAPIYTLVHQQQLTPPELSDAHIITSSLQKLPGATTNWQRFLPAMPYAIEQFDLREYQLIISSCHAVAKGVLTHSRQRHICYCYTPIRYIWDLYHVYLEQTRLSSFADRVFRLTAHYLRQWDFSAAQRVDKLLAISKTVQDRIRQHYCREAPVVYPPVDTEFFVPDPAGQRDYYLVVSRFVPYKRVDLVIDCFKYRDEKLLIVGEGPLAKRLRRMASRNVDFLGAVTDEELLILYQNCRALIFPAEEDFGLTPVECMACGRPVVSLGYGGASESVVDDVTGVHFSEQTPQALDTALDRFSNKELDPSSCRRQACKFDQQVFLAKIQAAADYLLDTLS